MALLCVKIMSFGMCSIAWRHKLYHQPLEKLNILLKDKFIDDFGGFKVFVENDYYLYLSQDQVNNIAAFTIFLSL